MSVTVAVNGTNYTIPQTSETSWGSNVTSWIQAISAATLQLNGGTFTLTADADFGASFGIKVQYLKSRSSNIASAGFERLANTDVISWRNIGNSANLDLKPDTSTDGVLLYNGVALASSVQKDSTFSIVDASDATKKILFDAAGTTGTTTTITGSQTVSRVLTMPDATDTFVVLALAQTLANKTFSNELTLTQISTPSTPGAGLTKLYTKSDGKVYKVGPDGLESVVGGAGGGGGLVWYDEGPNAPVMTTENSQQAYLFGAGLAQSIYTLIKVPSTFSAGNQINMKVGLYSPSSANTILLSSVATLVRKNTDAITSTTNQRTSTNAALTNTVASQAREATFDLTSTTGQINSVAVSPGDYIKVTVSRGSDSDTADLRFLPSAVEVTFS